MAKKFTPQISALFLMGACVASTQAVADRFTYEVSVTNLTRGQSFTPILFTTHKAGLHLYRLGDPASAELAVLAESGNTEPLSLALDASGKTAEVKTADGLLEPGATRTLTIKANKKARFMSMAAMLIPTNDAFVALDGIRLPKRAHQTTYYAKAYDAGSEPNDELCANIPGPVCQGIGLSAEAGGEDFVHVHAGIHGDGDDIASLNAAERDWRNPVAVVRIKRVKGHDDD